jgi:DNA repair protein RecO (recombination protein O)
MVRGGTGARLAPVLQPGNGVHLTWRARLDEHLGVYAVEGLTLRAASLLNTPHALFAVNHLAALCRLLPERDPHREVHDALAAILDHLEDGLAAAAHVARFELDLLAELGFGLELDRCAATGTSADLVYVSPRSGRAVSRAAGAPWHDRLLRLPAFLHVDEPADISPQDLTDAFALTGYFLERRVLEPSGAGALAARASFIAAALRAAATST